MGGTRCTYRNCTIRSDGMVHMFHYPVFDKVRCHQWLTNAHKLEFLNLKVSQLKNRVVCQHHFRDDNFMNFKRDKLTFDAVPTLDGPYCDPSQLADDNLPENEYVNKIVNVYSIVLEDLENDYMSMDDKKANLAIKYGDFLTNCEMSDLDLLDSQTDCKDKPLNDITILNNTIDTKPYRFNVELTDSIPRGNIYYDNELRDNMNLDSKPKDHISIEKTQAIKDLKITPCKPSVVDVEFEDICRAPPILQTIDQQQVKNGIDASVQKEVPKEKKIKIISEKTISEPVQLTGTFNPLSPSTVLPVLKERENIIETKPKEKKTAKIEINASDILENNIEKPFRSMNETKKQTIKPSSSNDLNLHKTNNQKIAKMSSIKHKIAQLSPERIAAIEKKRKFNMELKNIIETCLNKLDDQDKIEENTKYLHKLKTSENQNEQVTSYIDLSEPKLPHVDEYTLTYLVDKMKEMENNLLNKINQNSTSIMELKNSFPPSKNKEIKTTIYSSVGTQTVVRIGTDFHKKQLFNDISQYLSSDTKNLLYEELFLNKFVENVPMSSVSVKRRKYNKGEYCV